MLIKSLVEAVYLSEIIKPSQQALRDVLRKNKVEGKSHRIVTKWFYRVMKYQGILDKIIEEIYEINPKLLDPWLRAGLRSFLYLTIFKELSKKKYEMVKKTIASVLSSKTHPFVGMHFYSESDRIMQEGKATFNKIKQGDEFRYLLPSWFIEYFKKILRDHRKLFRALNRKPLISIRVNTLKASPDEVARILKEKYGKKVKRGVYLKEVLKFKGPFEFENCKEFREGYFVVQEEAAAIASIILDPKPGETVVDMCAAPGGKTEHMAELMKNKGIIYAFDIDEERLKRMKETLERCGIKIVKIFKEDARRAPEILGEGFADKVLLDAPCTSDGTLMKNPELRWRIEWRKVLEMQKLQKELLDAAAKLVKPGGKILYCTCSMFKEEDEDVIRWFLKKHKNFRVIPIEKYYSEGFYPGTRRAWPHLHKTIGFFYALLERIS